MKETKPPKLCFIIAHRYAKNYESYLNYTINNITTFYKDALILVVDNNSADLRELYNTIDKSLNVKFIVNNSESKFDLGAYTYGITYLIQNNLIANFDYFVMIQDTYLLINKYNFNKLITNNIKACSIVNVPNDEHFIHEREYMLNTFKIPNTSDAKMCWCNCLAVTPDRLLPLYNIIKQIKITVRRESEASERYMGNILYYLNNNSSYAIDGNTNLYTINNIEYFTCHDTYYQYKDVKSYFCKISQKKNETNS